MTNRSARKPSNLGQYLASTFTHPWAVFAELVDDPRGRTFAALALGTVAVLYSLTEWFLHGQTDPIPSPFLRIPTDQYYAWAALFCAPAIVGGWLLATGGDAVGFAGARRPG
jgi:hypothetical protein